MRTLWIWLSGLAGVLIAIPLTRAFRTARPPAPAAAAAPPPVDDEEGDEDGSGDEGEVEIPAPVSPYRNLVRICTAAFFAGLLLAIGIYQAGWAKSTDWRVIGLCFASSIVLPLLLIAGYMRATGRGDFGEFLRARSQDENMSPGTLRVIVIVCSGLIAMSVASYALPESR